MSEIKKLLKAKFKAISLGQYKEAAEICNALGNEFENEEKYEDALEQHIEELQYCEMVGDELSIAVANRKIGENYAFLNNFKKALQCIDKYYKISLSLNSVVEQQRALATIGRIYYLKYQYELASEISDAQSSNTLDEAELAYCKAFKLLDKLLTEMKPDDLAEMKCRLLLNWGLVLENRGDLENSCIKLKHGLDIATKYNLHEDIQRCGLSLGALYQKLNQYREADKVLNVALSTAKKLNNKGMICEILLSKGTNLILEENFDSAKKCLKSCYKLHTSNSEDHDKIVKALKVCIGVCDCIKKLKFCQKYEDKKILFEKIADGLSSVGCFKVAIKYYHLTLNVINEAGSTSVEKAPIYFSLAKSYLDDDNIPEALEYFEKEFSCNGGKPLEQIKTLWEISYVLEKEKRVEKVESILRKATSIAEKSGNDKILHNSLTKLLSFYESIGKINDAEQLKKKINKIKLECESDDEYAEEENSNPFDDVDLDDLSDSDNNEERVSSSRQRNKRFQTKVNVVGETPLHQACIKGDLNMVKRLVENGHAVNVRDFCGWTPLHEASNHGFYDIVEYLAEKGANINDPGGSKCGGISPLHDAAACGHFEVMTLLISKGASVTALDSNGETPLHALIQWKQRTDVDEVTIRQCEMMENDLKSKMKKAGTSVDNVDYMQSNAFESPFLNENSRNQISQKRSRSPSLSPEIISDDDEDEAIISTSPYSNVNGHNDWEDANNAKLEYKSVMENLRRSAAGISPTKHHPHEEVSGPPLVNENEVVNDWLIKDTKEIPKTKKKRRRLVKLNVRTSKCIDNYLIPQDSPETKDEDMNFPIVDEDSNFSISSIESTGKKTEFSPSQTIASEISHVSFCIRVNIIGRLILIPVPDDSSTISWLSEEAARRFQSLDGKKPLLILTKNGALLSDSDLIKNIFSNNEEVISTVEAWEEPSLADQYIQLCVKKGILASSSVTKRLHCSEPSSELNISNCSISPSHLSLIFMTLCNFKSLQHLNISGTPINNSNISDLISCISCFSMLHTWNMSCCCLTSECLKKLTDYLDCNTSQNILPGLKSLDLSFNCFSTNVCFMPLLNLSSLISLNLSCCSLNSSLFSNQAFLQMLEEKHSFEEFNVSGNNLGDLAISNLLSHMPKLSLKKLNLKHTLDGTVNLGSKFLVFFNDILPFLSELVLQGCHLNDADINHLSLCLVNCPQLQNCDFSGNSTLSHSSLLNFINKAHENHLNITKLNFTGTCIWTDQTFYIISEVFNFKNMKYFCLDKCSEDIFEKISDLWRSKWENRAMCLNMGFYEFSVI